MNRKSAVVSAVLLALVAVAAQAQDPVVVGPDVYKCTFENEHTRLCEVTFAPGAKIGLHSHPEHLLYVVAPGKLRITRADGHAQEADFEAGQAVWLPAETHQAQNIGATEFKAIVIEYKHLKGKS